LSFIYLFAATAQQLVKVSTSRVPPLRTTSSDSGAISLVLGTIWPEFCCCHFDADVDVAKVSDVAVLVLFQFDGVWWNRDQPGL